MPALNDCPWLNQKKQGAPKSYGLLSFSLFTSYHCGMYDVPDFKTHPFAKNNHKRVRDETSPLQTLLKCLVANCPTAKEFSAKPLLTPLVNLGSKSDHKAMIKWQAFSDLSEVVPHKEPDLGRSRRDPRC